MPPCAIYTSMQIIPNKSEKINPDTLFYGLTALIIVGCTIGGYLVGRNHGSVSASGVVRGASDSRVIIDTSRSDEFLQAEEERATAPRTIMASQNGTRYYPAGCTAGSNIKESNRIWFATENEAKMAGYSLAKACQ
jgi:hypothetical protein